MTVKVAVIKGNMDIELTVNAMELRRMWTSIVLFFMMEISVPHRKLAVKAYGFLLSTTYNPPMIADELRRCQRISSNLTVYVDVDWTPRKDDEGTYMNRGPHSIAMAIKGVLKTQKSA